MTLAVWGSGVRTPMVLPLAAGLQGDLVVDPAAGGRVLAGGVAMWELSCKSSEPEHDRGDDQFGLVVSRPFGITRGQVPELFEPIEAAFDHVALLVQLGVEHRRPSTTGAFAAPRAIWSARSGLAKATLRRRNA